MGVRKLFNPNTAAQESNVINLVGHLNSATIDRDELAAILQEWQIRGWKFEVNEEGSLDFVVVWPTEDPEIVDALNTMLSSDEPDPTDLENLSPEDRARLEQVETVKNELKQKKIRRIIIEQDS